MAGQVTDRDLDIVSFVARFPFVSLDQLHAWFVEQAGGGGDVSIIYRRLAVLKMAGMVEWETIVSRYGRVIWATRGGMRAVGVRGATVRPRIGQFVHDATVTDVALWIMRTRPTHRLVTEREIRAIDTVREQSALLWATPMPATQKTRLYPDLVSVAPSGARVVHEFEATAKGEERLVNVMLAHLASERVAAVRYYAQEHRVMKVVELAADRARDTASERGWNSRLTVVAWPPAEGES